MKNQSTALCEVPKSNKFKAIILKIGKRNLVVAASVLLIGAAVLLNFLLFTGADKNSGYDGYDQPSGNISDTPGNSTDTPTDNNSTYFRQHRSAGRERVTKRLRSFRRSWTTWKPARP